MITLLLAPLLLLSHHTTTAATVHVVQIKHYDSTDAVQLGHHPSSSSYEYNTVQETPTSTDGGEGEGNNQQSFIRNTLNALALLLLPLLCFTGLVGNAFVCVAIGTDRRLQNVTNYFLFSLALADLLVCCVVMPLSIVVEIKNGVWNWSFNLCLIYVYADVFLCSASIVHMSVISLDRYLGISQPLKTRNRTKTAIFIKITLVWAITILISSPIAVIGILDHENVLRKNACMVHNQYYMIYGSTLSFLIPFIIMAVTYVKTTSLLNKQAYILQHNGSQKGNGLRRSAPPRKMGYSLRRSSGGGANSVTTPTHSGSNHSNTRHKHSSISIDGSLDRALITSTGRAHHNATLPPSIWQGTATTNAATLKAMQASLNDEMPKSSSLRRWTTRTSSYLSALVSRVQRKNSMAQNQELLSEHKATRVLAVVFICFFICWTPFFVANFVSGFCGAACEIAPWASSLFLWLGYVSSTINPLIYTVFNKRFRTAFIRILRCRCFSSYHNNDTLGPNSHWSRTHTIMPDACTYTNIGDRSARDLAMSKKSGLENGISIDSIAPPQNKKSSVDQRANGGRNVAFDSRTPWSTNSSRKESMISNSRTPRKTSPLTKCMMTTRTNTEEEDEDDDNDSAVGTMGTGQSTADVEQPLVYRSSHSCSRTPSTEEEDYGVLDHRDHHSIVASTSSTSSSSTTGSGSGVRVTVAEQRKLSPYILCTSPSIKRSLTNTAILESPTRLVPTSSELIVAHPIVVYAGGRVAKLGATSPASPGAISNHIARGVACSETNVSRGYSNPSSEAEIKHDCTQTADGEVEDDEDSETSSAGTVTLRASLIDKGPALTLVGTNERGDVVKETFL